jgi:hypothetical protein
VDIGMVIRYYKTMSENFSTKDAKTKIENLLSLSEAYVKQLPRTDFQANPVFFQTNEATKTETDKNQVKSQSSLNFQKNGNIQDFSQNQVQNQLRLLIKIS